MKKKIALLLINEDIKMKFRLICLFAAMLFVLSACSSEQTKENKSASESQSEIASEATTDVSAEKDEYYEYNIVGDSNTVMLADEIPEETDFILMTSVISGGEPVMTISTDNDKKTIH